MIWNNASQSRISRAGFTLVELLVVIAIISILASLLLPALSNVMDISRGIQCINTERQLSLGNLTYVDEFDGWCVAIKDIEGYTWMKNKTFSDIIGVETDSWNWPTGFICPNASLSLSMISNGKAPLNHSYATGYNGFTALPNGVHSGYHLTKIKNPSEQLLYIDSTDWIASGPYSGADPARYATYGEVWAMTGSVVMTAYRHKEGANIAFFDGHAAWKPSEDVYMNNKLWIIDQ